MESCAACSRGVQLLGMWLPRAAGAVQPCRVSQGDGPRPPLSWRALWIYLPASRLRIAGLATSAVPSGVAGETEGAFHSSL